MSKTKIIGVASLFKFQNVMFNSMQRAVSLE